MLLLSLNSFDPSNSTSTMAAAPTNSGWVSMPPERRTTRSVATSMIHTSESGISSFQPSRMNWS